MAYAIQSFECTELGIEQLQLVLSNRPAELSVPLTKNEVKCLYLIHEYRQSTASLSLLSDIELQFQNIYETVNLTRLVVIKLLTFFDMPTAPDAIQDNQNPTRQQNTTPKNISKEPQVAQQKHNMKSVTKTPIAVNDDVDPILILIASSFD